MDAVQSPVRKGGMLAASLVVRGARSLTTLAVIALAAVFGYYQYSTHSLSRKVDELQQERTRLVEYAKRLSASRRLAQVNVVDQWLDDQGQTVSRLLDRRGAFLDHFNVWRQFTGRALSHPDEIRLPFSGSGASSGGGRLRNIRLRCRPASAGRRNAQHPLES